MKIRNNFIIITALCLATFALGSCDYWEPADQSSINISFDDSNARATSSLVSDMIYTITLTSPGKGAITKTTEIGETSISIPVSEGQWSIHVQGEGARRIGEGTGYVLVTAGKPASAIIRMAATGTKAYTYDQIVEDFKDDSLPQEFIIKIFGNEITANSIHGGNEANESPNIAILKNGKTITLRAANSDLFIKRGLITNEINSNVFRVTSGTLILDGETGGKITINGMKDDNGFHGCSRALINVEVGSSTLTMLGGVTLTNNTTGNGGGVYVSGSNSYFYMYGGTISNNTAKSAGGGVCIKSGGHFIKTGGTVFGSSAGSNSNTCTDTTNQGEVGGDSIYDNGKTDNGTYDEGKSYPVT